ncbi:MAG: serine/threonine protein phosphatase [Pirellulales bacterium]|nr:serine/threonine protein phosphatase [Pirellulales bacterium]
MPARTIAIGDIHGCSTALRALIEGIDPRPDDTIVTLGDYIDRGPDSRGVIETLIGLKQRCRLVLLMGNHEEMLFQAFRGPDDLRFWLQFGGEETLDSYGRSRSLDLIPHEHLLFLRRCRNYFETDTHIFVHASYSTDRRLDETSEQILRWLPITHSTPPPHFSGKTVIVGHTPQESGRILDLGHVKCIDTGCCTGGWLTALDVKSGHNWQANETGEMRIEVVHK